MHTIWWISSPPLYDYDVKHDRNDNAMVTLICRIVVSLIVNIATLNSFDSLAAAGSDINFTSQLHFLSCSLLCLNKVYNLCLAFKISPHKVEVFPLTLKFKILVGNCLNIKSYCCKTKKITQLSYTKNSSTKYIEIRDVY